MIPQEPVSQLVRETIERLLREGGMTPCEDKACPYCLRGLQRKCPNQDAWDSAIAGMEDGYKVGFAQGRSTALRSCQLTQAEIITIREGLRPLDCGPLYCRYCSAKHAEGHNNWQHTESCPYARSLVIVDEARTLLDRVQASLSLSDPSTPET